MNGVCPRCGGEAEQSQRYPDALCLPCTGRATDLSGRPVWLRVESMTGGFYASHQDDGSRCEQVTRDGRVLIDGIEHRAGEHRFGGYVVQPIERV